MLWKAQRNWSGNAQGGGKTRVGPMKAGFAVVATFATLMAGTAHQPLAAETKLRAVSFQGQSVSFAKPFYRWVRATNKRCDGRLEISVAGPETVRAQVQWHALKTGQIDMYYGPANYYRGALPEGDVFNLAHNEPAEQRRNGAWALLNELHNKRINAWYLTTLSAGIKFYIYTAKPAEGGRFEGFRLRSTPLYENFLRTLGANTHYIAASDLGAALERRAMDGYVWPLWSGGLGWEKFVKYRYGPGFLNAASPVLINLDRWNSLSANERKCLSDMALLAEQDWPKWRAAENARQLAALERAGIEYRDLGPSFGRKAEDIYWGMLRQAAPEFVHRIKPLLGYAE